MESLALAAAIIMLTIYGSSLLAFAFSWIKHTAGKVLTFIFAVFGIVTSLWLAYTLIEGNGLPIAVIPLALSSLAIWNTIRRNKKE